MNGTTEEKEDVIRYDYKLMDEAWSFLNKSGYEIYKRTESAASGEAN